MAGEMNNIPSDSATPMRNLNKGNRNPFVDQALHSPKTETKVDQSMGGSWVRPREEMRRKSMDGLRGVRDKLAPHLDLPKDVGQRGAQ